jgi:hypothetical protein
MYSILLIIKIFFSRNVLYVNVNKTKFGQLRFSRRLYDLMFKQFIVTCC